jgi:hypothetical protein
MPGLAYHGIDGDEHRRVGGRGPRGLIRFECSVLSNQTLIVEGIGELLQKIEGRIRQNPVQELEVSLVREQKIPDIRGIEAGEVKLLH